MHTMRAREREDAPEPFQPSPPAEIRRGAAVVASICAVVLGLGRVLFWRGPDTTTIAAFALFFLLLYTIFGFVQVIFGVSISEVYSNFKGTSGKQKLVYFGMLALTMGLLIPLCGFLFPGIDAKIHR